jgi:hypothetical protein
MQIFWLLVPVLLMASGCFSVPDPEYKTRLTKIPQFLRDHFPNQLPNDGISTLITNTDTTSHCIYYFLLQYGDDSASKLVTSNIAQQVLATYHAADTNIISIKRETVTYRNPEKKRYYTDKIQNNKYYYPVPYFETKKLLFYKGEVEDIYSNETISGLSRDFMIYVYDFETGSYWEGLKPLDYLPEGWENGYSKGVAVSKNRKVLIHWFVVW